MSLETAIDTLLKTICVRTFPDVAKAGTDSPYVTWQVIGGASVNYVDDAIPDIENAIVQVSVWSTRRLEANDMMRQVEDAIRTSPAFSGRPVSQPNGTYEEHVELHGAIQRFTIWSAR